MILADTIRENAGRLHALHRRVHSTARLRARSDQHHEAWQRACADFHGQFDVLAWPGGATRWAALLRGDTAEIEVAIDYLDVDPMHFRSGYRKERIWQRLNQSALSDDQLRRLERIGLAYLARQTRREFWHMVRFARRRAGAQFWSEVETLSAAPARTPEAIKATWLVLARDNAPVRVWIARERLRPQWEPGRAPDVDFRQRWTG